MHSTRLQTLLGRYAIFKGIHKDQKPDGKSELERLKGVVNKTNTPLKRVSGVFPFDLFPDSITIDRQKLTIVNRQFIGIHKTVTVPVADIKNVQANVGPVLGSVIVTSEHFVNNTATVKFLRRKDALEIQRLVQGIMIALKENIDINAISKNQLLDLLSNLGKGT